MGKGRESRLGHLLFSNMISGKLIMMSLFEHHNKIHDEKVFSEKTPMDLEDYIPMIIERTNLGRIGYDAWEYIKECFDKYSKDKGSYVISFID